jgi:hypothetical protein
LSPANWQLWQQAEPPPPAKETWAAVEQAVSDGVFASPATPAGPRPPSFGWWKRPGMWAGAAAVVGFSVLVVVWLSTPTVVNGPPPDGPDHRPELAARGQPDDPLAEFAVLPMAGAADVDVRQVAGNAGASLVIGEPPLAGPLALADEDDVELQDAEPHPAWPTGNPRMTTAPGDAPIIFAAPPRIVP